MQSFVHRGLVAGVIGLAGLLSACDGDTAAPGETAAPSDTAAQSQGLTQPETGLKAGKGVDLATKTIRIGTLNDESGPAATIGKPYAAAKRILAAQVNAGDSGLLPEGWKIQLVEKDHGYNPQKSVQAYNQIKDDVLFIATSFGTPNTLPLRPMLTRDKMVVLPASQSSQMAEHRYTIPGAPTYEVEAMRAMDWVVAETQRAGKDKATIKAGIVYQQDDYGQDGLLGWRKAAKHHGIAIVSEQTVTPGQRDFAAVVSGLKEAGATHVLLTILPSASGPLLGNASQLEYKPVWLGQTPTWIDGFFDADVVPHKIFETYYWVSSATYWGEDVPGMKHFLEVYERYGKQQAEPDFYLLASYIQGLYGLALVSEALSAGDITREGIVAAVSRIENFDAGGLVRPVSTNSFPYVTSTLTRVLKPDFKERSWTVVAPYASPLSLAGAGSKTAALERVAPRAPARPSESALAQR